MPFKNREMSFMNNKNERKSPKIIITIDKNEKSSWNTSTAFKKIGTTACKYMQNLTWQYFDNIFTKAKLIDFRLTEGWSSWNNLPPVQLETK